MKPFATIGSEISKVRDRVRRGADALRPAKVASDVRDQRDRLLAKLGEQTFRLIAERKLVVPKLLQDSVERLASLLGVQLPPVESREADGSGAGAKGDRTSPPSAVTASERANAPLTEPPRGESDAAKLAPGPSLEAAPSAPAEAAPDSASRGEGARPPRRAQKKSAKRRGKR